MSLVEIDDLTVTYRSGQTALHRLRLTVEPGATLAVVGESGSGKSTLALAVLGLLPPGAEVGGSIRLDGEELVGASPRRIRRLRGRTIGYVPQDPFAAFDPMRPVRDHLVQAWRATGTRPAAHAVAEALTQVGLEPARARQRPHQWSGGMLQRATIAAATVHGPPLTIADEPTSALDTDNRDAVLSLLRRRSHALLLISHDLGLVAGVADHVAVLRAGRLVETGPAGTVLTGPRHPFTRDLAAAAGRCARPSDPAGRR
ncbi:hypothetical protein BJF78_13605 [Pseudonocardia sp. CNS-139]|nr:hypothetical protein BJF78_13605 [Pseudonocardia sp. CNS-139]